VQLNFPLTGLDSNWQTFSYLLSKGSVAAGSKTNFTAYFNKIDQLQPQFQIESGAAEATWGFDSDNALVIDNFKLERIDVGCPPLAIRREANSLVATWNAPSAGTAKLQSATEINGTYTDVTGASNPYPVPVSGTMKFYRTIWVPPTP